MMLTRSRFLTAGTALALAGLALWPSAGAHAFTISITSGQPRLFLHVGNGTADGNNATVNLVQVTVTAPQLGTGTPLAMTADSTQSTSLSGNGSVTCPVPSQQVMLGAAYRRPNTNARDAILQVTSPASLTNADGETIPFSEISWVVSEAGNPSSPVVPAGTFNGATQTLATVRADTYIETCHSFRFANTAMRAAGTYRGQVTYTLSTL